jgi:lipopolysaccharide export LptBFGC system permease protein LptF
VTDWPETPWSIISSSLVPDYMSVQELVSYLRAHAALAPEKLAAFRVHFHHRFAYSWLCFVAAFVAAPLGISFSRRGVLGGVAGAIAFLGALLFLNQFFISMGKGLRFPPWLCVWMPHLILMAAGAYLFYFRARNRDIPMPSLRWLGALRKIKRTVTRPRPAASGA